MQFIQKYSNNIKTNPNYTQYASKILHIYSKVLPKYPQSTPKLSHITYNIHQNDPQLLYMPKHSNHIQYNPK